MEYEYVLEGNLYPDEAAEFESAWTCCDPDMVASDAGEDYYNDDPDPAEYPLRLEVYSEGKSIGVFEVSVDFSPDFTAVAR